jgi:signal peptidase I
MSVTLIITGAMVGLLVLQWTIFAWFLQSGLRVAKASNVTFASALASVGILWLIQVLLLLICAGVLVVIPDREVGMVLVMIVLVMLVSASGRVLCRRHQTSKRQAFVACIAIQLASILNWLLTDGIVRPYCMEAFRIPANSMAPTVCGEHLQEQCPLCGGTLIISSASVNAPRDQGICVRCLHVSEVPINNRDVISGDRVLVLKFLKPRRWDIIAFRYPDDPSVTYLKRLIGLPREVVAIQDGDILVNGKRTEKPGELTGPVYVANPDRPQQTQYGPVELKEDESFVLGDFSPRSKDSRMWQIGAPGHPAYAVPDSHFVGVMTHIYWPPSRWRVVR